MGASRGFWIWTVAACEHGDAAAITERAVAAGLGHVLVKTNDGIAAYNGKHLGSLVGWLQRNGIHVWSWQYLYGLQPKAEAAAFAARAAALGATGLVIDAETYLDHRPETAAMYMEELKRLSALPVALSTYYRPITHPTFPWKAFLDRCDFAMPQVYWYKNPPERTVRETYAEYRKFIAPSKIIPTGAAYPEGAGDAGHLRTFIDAAERAGAGMMNFWEWAHATPAYWEIIAHYDRPAKKGGSSP